ncbi:hypothetical protein M0R04_08350 [Candidatus Dojkabacteria bacterium]|jgi:hypothetical protein|nr:hypothetical protein [Candidatus Dojkabacteria bacterium]
MAHHKIELDYECTECKGTGLYVGLAERDGFAVVCYKCKGTGKAHFTFEYDDFKERKERTNILQVLEVNPGIVAGIGKDKQYNQQSFGGMPYHIWKELSEFPQGSEMRQFTCPAWWYQIANYDKKPDWIECQNTIGSTFSHCSFFNRKDKCWQRFDKEH